jgi:predicted aspartyl protease
VTLAPFTGKPKITVKLTITRSNLLCVPVRIGDGYLDTLIDTGASYTFMDMSMLEIISKKDPQFSTVQLQDSGVGAIECSNGSHQEILGQFETTLQIGSVCFDAVIQVAENQPVPFILGGDALEKIAALVDSKNKNNNTTGG